MFVGYVDAIVHQYICRRFIDTNRHSHVCQRFMETSEHTSDKMKIRLFHISSILGNKSRELLCFVLFLFLFLFFYFLFVLFFVVLFPFFMVVCLIVL